MSMGPGPDGEPNSSLVGAGIREFFLGVVARAGTKKKFHVGVGVGEYSPYPASVPKY